MNSLLFLLLGILIHHAFAGLWLWPSRVKGAAPIIPAVDWSPCPKGRNISENWIENDTEYRCDINSKGATVLTVVACKDERGRTPTLVTTIVGDKIMKCVVVNGKGKLLPVPATCANGRKYQEEWEEGSFVKHCVDDGLTPDAPNIVETVFDCVYEGVRIPVGYTKSFGEDSWCSCVREDGIPEPINNILPQKAMMQCVFNTGTKEHSSLTNVKCSNGRKLGERWTEANNELRCEISRDGKSRVTVLACKDDRFIMERLSLRETEILRSGEIVKCVDINGVGQLVPLPPTCPNGRKLEEEWEDGSFVRNCRDDGITTDAPNVVETISYCLYEGVRIRVGEDGIVPSGKCRCFRDDLIPAPESRIRAQKARMECTINGKTIVRSSR